MISYSVSVTQRRVEREGTNFAAKPVTVVYVVDLQAVSYLYAFCGVVFPSEGATAFPPHRSGVPGMPECIHQRLYISAC